ncbi:carbohydrate kinase family protein [Candidatus Aerophobetes bacterium]|uniref:Carbohydrate kinase family protein n=1 Tax=Aerophobetes bacterium TaxID=2030807 RepID=A0A523V017_UNCAE|nr:MAG: carbohydrate kinase family protein [Candidatus Aerophobetes bacterium]
MSMDVVGLGALNVDLIYEADLASLGLEAGRERVGSFEEFKDILRSLKREGKLRMRSGGGSAANTVYALGKMGISSGLVGKVGQDEEGDFLLQDLQEAGVDTSRVTRNKRTGLCIVLLGRKRDRSILILPGANDSLSYPEIDLDYVNKAEFLHMSSFLGEIPFHMQKEVTAKTGAKISFDPGEPHAIRGIKELVPIFKRCFILFPSGREIETITGKNYKEGARELLEYGIKIIACTLGEKGSYILSREVELQIPPFKTQVLDTTGAGDVYAAGFLSGLLKGLPLIRCAKFASKAASLSVAGYGRSSYPDAELLGWILQKEN